MPDKFYGVAFGYKRGIFDKWTDCQAQTVGFPQPVFKKFDTREEAEEFVNSRQPTSINFDVDKSSKVFYAVARGKVAGIFTEFSVVKEHIAGFPQPIYKKFSIFDEAKAYYEKFANGIDDNKVTDNADKAAEPAGGTESENGRKRAHDTSAENKSAESDDGSKTDSDSGLSDDDGVAEKRAKLDANANESGEPQQNIEGATLQAKIGGQQSEKVEDDVDNADPIKEAAGEASVSAAN